MRARRAGGGVRTDPVSRAMTAELIELLPRLQTLLSAWDALAVACCEPMASPAWTLAWWDHVAPEGAELRVVSVHEDEELVALAPFYALPREPGPVRYRPLADDFSANVALLAAPGRAEAAAAAVAEALTARDGGAPDVLELGPLEAGSPWTAGLRDRWPGRMRPLVRARDREVAATVPLDGGYDGWLEGRSAQFRKTLRRRARAFEREGGTMRLATAATVDADVATFARLHRARWDGRGDSRLVGLGPRLEPWLRDLAERLLAQERFRLWIAEVGGESICADLSIAAGGEVVGVNTGWDERFKRLSPVQLVTARKIEDCCERGERRLNMGWGSLDYKRAFADGSEPVAWDALFVPGRRLPRTLAHEARRAATARLRRTRQ